MLEQLKLVKQQLEREREASSSTSSNPLSSGGSSTSVVVGSANFPENELLATVYAQALQAKGIKVSTKLNIGAREVYYPQVEKGTISIIPEYNGTLLTVEVDKTSTAKTTADVDAALAAKLPSTLAGAQPGPGAGQRLDHRDPGDREQVPPEVDRRPEAVRGEHGARRAARVQDSLRRHRRPEGDLRAHLQELRPARRVGPADARRPADGKVQAADVFTTTPQIVTDKLVSLADPKFNFAAQNVIPLVYKPAMNATIINTLNAVDAKLTTEALLQMDNAVITEHASYSTVAAGFLQAEGLS